VKICVIGTGYVGLVVGTCFSESGHQVWCIDQDERKIGKLQKGQMPIYEPGLQEILNRNLKEKRLTFTTDLKTGVENSEFIFISVGTPSLEGGAVDLKYVLQVAQDIAPLMNGPKVVVIKSTVPCGTSEKVEKILKDQGKHPVDVVVNPEFLK